MNFEKLKFSNSKSQQFQIMNNIVTNNKFKKYRAEIDGLRAFAVIVVIINHFNKDILPSGYLGVDIFFVISGYVITSSLSWRKSDTFNDFFIGFFERRGKRLIPALIPFTLLTGILICFFNPIPELSLRTGITSLFGLSNLYLLRQSTDYFAFSTQLNSFTHTWSLDVEEQFYVVFPFLVWFTGYGSKSKNGSKNLFFASLFLIVISLISYIYTFQINQSAAYYLMPTRFWEMAAGCFVFLLLNHRKNETHQIRKINPNILFLLICLVLFIPEKYSLIATILIVFLTSILLCCLNKGSQIFNILTSKFSLHFGKISYSLYLYHWTILSISRWTIGVHLWSAPFQIALMYVLAYLSFRYIETPFRDIQWSKKRWETILRSFSLLVLSGTTLFGLNNQFKGKLFLGNKDIKLDLKRPYFETYKLDDKFCFYDNFIINWYNNNKKNYTKENIFQKCLEKNKNNKQTLYFVGDSHTHSLWLGAEYISKVTKSNLFTLSAGAATFPSIKYFRKDLKEHDLFTNKLFKSLQEYILSTVKEGDVLFINLKMPLHFGEYWYNDKNDDFNFFDENDNIEKRESKKKHFEEWLEALVNYAKLLDKKGAKLIISNPTPEFPDAWHRLCKGQYDQWYNKFSRKDCTLPKNRFISKGGKYYQIIEQLKVISKSSKNIYIFDAFETMCPKTLCKFSENGRILYRDSTHISNYAILNKIAPDLLIFLKKNNILIKN